MSLRRFLNALFLLAILAVGAASALYFLETRGEYERYRRDEAKRKRELAALELKLAEQEKILERLRDKEHPGYVDRIIRERLGYAKPDEFIFRFEDQTKPATWPSQK